MKSVIKSLRPEVCMRIANGEQSIIVAKSAPKEVPFKAYIYMTATKERCRFWEYITAYQNNKGDILDGSQKVIGSFVCDGINHIHTLGFDDKMSKQTCLTFGELARYLGGVNGMFYTKIHLTDYAKKFLRKNYTIGDFH